MTVITDLSAGVTPDGVEVRRLTPHDDDRGRFTEIYRDEWVSDARPIQWNSVRSRPGVLRGVHVHRSHADVLTVVSGRLVLALVDLRAGRATHSSVIDLRADEPTLVTIPVGVAHGFWFPESSIHVYSVTEYFDPADELGCRWDDPGLGIPWAPGPVSISDRDRVLPSLDVLLHQLHG